MSEKFLNETIRSLREAVVRLNMAQGEADALLRDHNVSTSIIYGKKSIEDLIDYLEHEYREKHYQRRR